MIFEQITHNMVFRLLGNKSCYSNKFILIFPKSKNDVRL